MVSPVWSIQGEGQGRGGGGGGGGGVSDMQFRHAIGDQMPQFCGTHGLFACGDGRSNMSVIGLVLLGMVILPLHLAVRTLSETSILVLRD